MTAPIPADVTAVAPSIPPAKRVPSNYTPYGQYLWRQAQRIKMRGGTDADIGRYLRDVEGQNLQAVIEDVPEMPGPLGLPLGFVQHVMQGVTFGFGDEALGTLVGLLSDDLSAQEGRDLYRAQLASYQDRHRAMAFGGQLAGAAMLPAGVLARGGKIASGLFGAGAAGLAGAGEAEGGLSERARQALAVAPMGFATGAVLPPILRGAAKLPGKLSNAVMRVTPQARERLTSLLQRIPGTPQHAARVALAERIAADGLDVAAVARAVEERNRLGLGTTVADVTGNNVLSLGLIAQEAQTPQAQQLVRMFTENYRDKGVRILESLGEGATHGLKNAHTLGQQLMAQKYALAQPHYRLSFESNFKVTPGVRRALETDPMFRDAWEAGRQLAAREDNAALNFGAQSQGLAVPELPVSLEGVTELPVRGIQYMKVELDNTVRRAMQANVEGQRPLSGRSAKTIKATLNSVLGDVDEQVPAFKTARGIWSGFEDQIGEIRRGYKNFLNKPPETIAQEIADSRAPEMYRVGAVQALADAVHGGPPTAEAASRFFGANLRGGTAERADARRIRALFTTAHAAEEFMDRLAGEAASSRAAEKFMAQGVRPNLPGVTRELAPAGRIRRAAEATHLAAYEARQTRAQEIAREISMLFMKGLRDPNELVALLHSLDGLEQVARRATGTTRLLSGVAGAQVEQR